MIVIKNTEMPECCAECPCMRHDSYEGIHGYQCNITLETLSDDLWDRRADSCPMKEVKGPIIDRNELMERFVPKQAYFTEAIICKIMTAPAVEG